MVYNLRKKKPTPPQKEPEDDDSGSEKDLEETDSEDDEYDPDATESEEESEDESEEDVDLEMIDFSELGKNYRFGSSAPSILFICPPHKRKQYDEDEDEDEDEDGNKPGGKEMVYFLFPNLLGEDVHEYRDIYGFTFQIMYNTPSKVEMILKSFPSVF